ncbi:hypothetical protein Pse7367_1225 [Thalassoporum mexicanum PCC 7367]|uniref:hypothetical protein n=1 Tax=Thalassoporum mexicanum TaxID=3457544 RepID=UPI00029FC38E|nr:hypothetical protein [Pseudanabaena sp. PCC 7367]AFY69520.1 hypothetical protein Pse7367_1225 [Pseudanabaena sp. PCC 7367]
MTTRSPYPLFQRKTLKNRIATFGFPADLTRRASKIVKWLKYINDGKQPDEASDAEFLHDLFVEVLGYRSPFGEDSRGWEFEFQPSPALGFFFEDGLQVVAEIFIHGIDREIQPQHAASEWLIAIDYKCLRLYHKSKPKLFYQQFSLGKLIVDADYLRQFYFILCRRTLLPGLPNSQERSRILQLLEESQNAEMVIARDFYSYFHKVRLNLVKDFRYRLQQIATEQSEQSEQTGQTDPKVNHFNQDAVDASEALDHADRTDTSPSQQRQDQTQKQLTHQQRHQKASHEPNQNTDRHPHDQAEHGHDRAAHQRRHQQTDPQANPDFYHSPNANPSDAPNQSPPAKQLRALALGRDNAPLIASPSNKASTGASPTQSTPTSIAEPETSPSYLPSDISPAQLTNLAITQVQKLLDRIMFIAAGEDRQMLPTNLLKDAYEFENPYRPQPAWDNYKAIFNWVYGGISRLNWSIPAYGSSLFQFDPLLDRDLFVGEEFCRQLKELTRFDFGEDISSTAIAYILEETLRDLLLLRQEAETGEAPKRRKLAFPPRSLLRAEYIPVKLTKQINARIAELLAEDQKIEAGDRHEPALEGDYAPKGDSVSDASDSASNIQNGEKTVPAEEIANPKLQSSQVLPPAAIEPTPANSPSADLSPPRPHNLDNPAPNIAATTPETRLRFWQLYQQALSELRIVDPKCGSGVELAVAFDFLLAQFIAAAQEIQKLEPVNISTNASESARRPTQAKINLGAIAAQILQHNIYGCDPNPDAVATTKFHLWLRSAPLCNSLLPLAQNIRAGDLRSSGLAADLESESWQGNLIMLSA